MNNRRMLDAVIESQTSLTSGIFDLVIGFPEDYSALDDVRPGQFVSLYTHDKSRLLPRPVSICEILPGKRQLRLVYRVAGKGTAEFSHMKAGDRIKALGPLGNGYDINENLSGKVCVVIGGGIGIPPMLGAAEKLSSCGARVYAALGYRTDDTFLKKDFEKYSRVIVSTDDGSTGFHGNAVDALKAAEVKPDLIYACGPLPMLKGVKQYGAEEKVPTFISLEERMACGIGACLGCVVETVKEDGHSHVNNARVCRDGPVFNAQDVVL